MQVAIPNGNLDGARRSQARHGGRTAPSVADDARAVPVREYSANRKPDASMKPAKGATSLETKRRIFLVEDHPITRRGLLDLINQEPDLVVCGEADDAVQALESIKALKPDLALVDISLPRRSGLVLLKDIRLWAPEVYVVVLSLHDESLYAERVLHAGGHGYIMKNQSADKLLYAIRTVLHGDTYVSESVSKRIVDSFAGRRKEPGNAILSHLTDREFEVFQLMGQGLPTAEIGRLLHLSPKTVDSHRLHIKEKLQLHTLPELMRYAVRWAATEELL